MKACGTGDVLLDVRARRTLLPACERMTAPLSSLQAHLAGDVQLARAMNGTLLATLYTKNTVRLMCLRRRRMVSDAIGCTGRHCPSAWVPFMRLHRPPSQCALTKERLELLRQLEPWLDAPMLVLAFAWLVLLVVELVWGLTPLLETIGTAVWSAFLLDFGLRFALSPGKLAFLRQRWLTAVALARPALRAEVGALSRRRSES